MCFSCLFVCVCVCLFVCLYIWYSIQSSISLPSLTTHPPRPPRPSLLSGLEVQVQTNMAPRIKMSVSGKDKKERKPAYRRATTVSKFLILFFNSRSVLKHLYYLKWHHWDVFMVEHCVLFELARMSLSICSGFHLQSNLLCLLFILFHLVSVEDTTWPL